MHRILVPLLLLVTVAMGQPAQAAGVKEGAPGTNVEMPFLIAPMSKDGKLLGYAYISSKMVTSSPGAAIAVRNKLAFIQDAYVRDVNAQPIAKADDPRAVDETLLNARLVAAARRIVGSDKVVSMVFIAVQFAPLHPGETTPNPAPPPESAGTGDAAPVQDRNKSQTEAPAASPVPATSEPAQHAIH
jgi:hypothetical protein